MMPMISNTPPPIPAAMAVIGMLDDADADGDAVDPDGVDDIEVLKGATVVVVADEHLKRPGSVVTQVSDAGHPPLLMSHGLIARISLK